MSYPDTTRTVHVGVEAVERVQAAVMKAIHTMNEPAHTLENGIIVPRENTGSRVKDNGQSRGKRSSTLRLQGYIRLDEIGIWLESAIGAGTTVNYPDYTSQTVTITGTPTGGFFKLNYAGQTTADIAHNATNAAVQSALEALSNIAPGDVTVTGSAGGPYTIVFEALGNLAGNWIPLRYTHTLTGGTTPGVTLGTTGTVTDAYRRSYAGGVVRGLSLSIRFFNGLYWRRMLGARVNTMNIQAFGDQLAMVDMELLGQASSKIAAPTAIPYDETYNQVDVPMQVVRFEETMNADVLRMAININNNLAFRATMDGTVNAGRVRFGDFDVALDGMADYPAYEGSLYEKFETNEDPGEMDVIMIDDQMEVGTGTGSPVNPGVWFRLPQPVLLDTAEGDDGGEFVQMIRGRAQLDQTLQANILVYLWNDKPASYYAAS